MVEFKIKKYDNNGNPIVNEAGDVVYTTFIYNFDTLGIDRKMMAVKLYELAEKQYEELPKTTDELSILVARQTEIKALAAILVRYKNGEPELYDYQTTGFSKYELNELGQGDDYNRIEAVKKDFFSKAQIRSGSGMKEFANLTTGLLELVVKLRAAGIDIKSMEEITRFISTTSEQTVIS